MAERYQKSVDTTLCLSHNIHWNMAVRKYNPICSAPGCDRKHHAKGYCNIHAGRMARYGSLDLPVRMSQTQCKVPSCTRLAASAAYCNPHAHRLRRYGDPEYRPLPDYSHTDLSLYGVWSAMKARCTNPNVRGYENYGARGVWVCDGWKRSYQAFIDDMGTRPDGMSLDRINNDGGYTCGHCSECRLHDWPANVRWADRVTQANNTRANHSITVLGETHTIAEWTRIKDYPRGMIADRILSGWSEQDAVLKPRASRYNERKVI